MTAISALSIAPFAAELLTGPSRSGIGLGHGHILFDDQVLALTQPGQPRMPNGIETNLRVAEREAVMAGDGLLITAAAALAPGPLWDPRPLPLVALSLHPKPHLQLDRLAGRGPGLTPLGDDILIGYLAAAALHEHSEGVTTLAAETARETTTLSATLIRLAAGGALPEAAHQLLIDGDPEPLLHFGASSGMGIAFGLALFGIRGTGAATGKRVIPLGDFELVINAPPDSPNMDSKSRPHPADAYFSAGAVGKALMPPPSTRRRLVA
jgi:uncharacterized protein DUF2877